jgi:hypothetical protein
VTNGGQGVALELAGIGDGQVIQPEGEIGKVAEEGEPGVAPVDLGIDVPVGRFLGLGGDLALEEEREDQEQDQQESEQATQDDEDSFHAF